MAKKKQDTVTFTIHKTLKATLTGDAKPANCITSVRPVDAACAVRRAMPTHYAGGFAQKPRLNGSLHI